ncbi:Ig-like domain-containing protein [Candidatus Nitrososphaera sp. FF02]|uniref:Ig-like domain-containing protein n=1 Tax=Candidatus Nitrososphaera sp. FF02 TaxID=3398226 RepID=UPI0039ECB0F9
MKDSGREVNPFEVKSILMSSAKDLHNDPFVQGSGRVDALAAVELARGESGRFSIYTDDTAENLLATLAPTVFTYAGALGIIDSGYLIQVPGALPDIDGPRPESRWFAGHVEQGKTAETGIIVHNPTKTTLHVQLSSVVEKLVARYEMTNSTRVFELDPTHKKDEYGYAPNYYSLTEMAGELPDADLMVARVNFPFASFMNSTELFADRLRIASVYAYNWDDADSDGNVTFSETALINRGGAWGTTQEVRVSDPKAKFTGTPVIGVYPVPDVYSFWRGDTRIDAAPMNYTLTVEFYKRMPNPDIVLDKNELDVPAGETGTVNATITATDDAISGVYYGEIMASSPYHTAMMPVSYAVATKPVPKDVPVVVSPGTLQGPEVEKDLGLRPNGYVGGLSDMTSRYAAGDWRSYYFTVSDPTITSMSLKISWPHNSTSINAMAFGPDGQLVASSVPAGVFQEFAGWPSNDWLGTSAFSEGGAFYFSQNAGDRATIMHVPVEKQGVYSVLVHNTLFHGESLYEPLSVEAKFSTLVPDTKPPVIAADFPQFVPGGKSRVTVTLEDENPAGLSYAIDGNPAPAIEDRITIDGSTLKEGVHTLTVESTDAAGNSAIVSSQFTVDRTPPVAELYIVEGNATRAAGATVAVAGQPTLAWNVTDANGVRKLAAVILPGAGPAMLSPSHSAAFNATGLPDGRYNMTIISRDVPGNKGLQTWDIIVDNTAPDASVAVAGGDVRGTTNIALDIIDENPGPATLLIGDRMEVNVTGMSEYALDTTGLPDGEYEIQLAATDAAGNADTAVAMLTVANVKPTIEMTAILGVAGGLAAGAAVAWAVARRQAAKKS